MLTTSHRGGSGHRHPGVRTMTSRVRLSLIVCLAGAMCLAAVSAYAQAGSTKTSLNGIVVDTGGGVIPGATVTVKNIETGTSFETTTNASGVFVVPALDAGVYSVTVSLQGFKTSLIKE